MRFAKLKNGRCHDGHLLTYARSGCLNLPGWMTTASAAVKKIRTIDQKDSRDEPRLFQITRCSGCEHWCQRAECQQCGRGDDKLLRGKQKAPAGGCFRGLLRQPLHPSVDLSFLELPPVSCCNRHGTGCRSLFAQSVGFPTVK